LAVSLAGWAQSTSTTGKYKVVGWNDLGMHCVDGNDYSIFSILPPYNNLHVNVVDSQGKLVKNPTGITVTYEAVADPDKSINRSSSSKTNFWNYAEKLFGVKLAPDMGLAGNAMPGPLNKPQVMKFDAATNQFVAEGIPITPYPDGGGTKNYYPLMRVRVKSSSGTTLAYSDVVLPVSDEMDCTFCHKSGTNEPTVPKRGWAWNADPNKDYKLNILALHDERHATKMFDAAQAGTPALCAGCHSSNALGTAGAPGVASLTKALHGKHAMVLDARNNNLPLDHVDNRSACYNCHPGSVTKCLRGAMGNAGMQCQSCHGSMSNVAGDRRGWLDEPSCEQCHTGTAIKNSGQIRFTSVFVSGTQPRVAADPRFAVNANALYRKSSGHGGLNCEACHGSTHAEYPSSHRNDNLQNIKLQGRAGTLAECSSCHVSGFVAANGPHGLHTIGAAWVTKHHDLVESQGLGSCQACHGVDYRGTVLSAALAPRSFSTEHGTKTYAKGQLVTCYDCHNGPRGGD
jgi:hypothetical protein